MTIRQWARAIDKDDQLIGGTRVIMRRNNVACGEREREARTEWSHAMALLGVDTLGERVAALKVRWRCQALRV